MTQWSRAMGALAVAGVLAAAGACSSSEDGDSGEGSDSVGTEEEAVVDEVRLVELVNENNRLRSEVNDAEIRLEQTCLEDQGFTVHDQYRFFSMEVDETEALIDRYPYADFLPEADAAARWGFGVWASTTAGEGSAEAEEYNDAVYGEDRADPEPDNSAWDQLSAEDQMAWDEAYSGETGDGDASSGAFGSSEAETARAAEVAQPGGCQLAVIDSLYGGLEQVEVSGDDQSYTSWRWGPENPLDEADFEGMSADYRDATQEVEQDLVDCVADKGLGEWRFNDLDMPPVVDYFYWVYNADHPEFAAEDPEESGMPALPDDLPGDFEGRKAYEIETAVGMTECGDSTSYREVATAAWDEIQIEYYLSIEADLFAYQEGLRGLLTTAQELMDA